MKDIIKNNIYDVTLDILQTGHIENLSTLGNKFLNKFQSSIIGEIKEKGLKFSSDIVKKYVDNLNLETTGLSEIQISTIKTELTTIPKKLFNAALRSKI